ncbi:MAG: M50 family metallopeptidase [Lawsonella sp.]
MAFALGIILFILGIAISVALHEAGHLLTAKAFKMRVRRYFIGFGPTLFKTKRKGTEYGLKALPLGGFCDIAGMTILDEDLTAEEKPHAMYKKPAYQRIIVMLGGITANILIGVILVYSVAVGWGLPNLRSPMVTRVAETTCVADQLKDGSVETCEGQGPAAAAGVKAGDIILKVNGEKITETEQVIALTQESPQTVTYTIKRDGQIRDLVITPTQADRVRDGDLVRVPVTGVSIRQEPLEPMKNYNAATAVPAAFQFSWDINKLIVKALVKIPAQMPGLVKAIFGGERAADTPMSIVGASVAGGDALAFGSWSVFLMLMAQINFCLALFNLIPLPPLDGGHVAVICYEKIRDAVRKMAGKEPVGPADYSKLLPLTSIVVFLLVALFIITVAADVVNPIRLVK